MYYAVVGEREIPVVARRRRADADWGGRDCWNMTAQMTHAEAAALFEDDTSWGLKFEPPEGSSEEAWEQDLSEYSMAGPITDYRNGTVMVKMGKATAEELLNVLLGG